MSVYFWGGLVFWIVLLLILVALRPKSRLHRHTLEHFGRRARALTCAVLIAVILINILPMGLCPIWNGQIPDNQRDQYERLAEAMLDGRLYIDRGEIDPKLLEMKDPYDPDAREAAGASFSWDHAFYNGRYYVYFGVVPVLLLFLPYRAITGASLDAYRATQIFAALFICGVFALFYLLARRFFRKLSQALYLTLAAGLSCVSVWYSATAPAMYCTAVTAGLCMEIWSLYFFAKAVWVEEREWRGILWAALGSLFGALTFGCRPPIALANLLVLPMLAAYLRKWKFSAKRLGQLALAASPYLVVAALLMAYNAARFGNPFDFGQRYQLTLANLHKDGLPVPHLSWALRSARDYFTAPARISRSFPYVSFGGALLNFPILAFSLACLLYRPARRLWKREGLRLFIAALFLVPMIVSVIDSIWSPVLLPRYRMDIYWLLGILCFLTAASCHACLSEGAGYRFSFWMSLWSCATILCCCLFFLVPYDWSLTEYNPETLVTVKKILTLGLYR